jgi:hypothetical protein
MYELYLSGQSLGSVARAYGRTRQSVWQLFRYHGWERRPQRPPLPFIMYGGNKYTLRNTGYYGKTNGKRTLLHRDVWEDAHGKIPKGWDVHHLDCDRENNALSNLEILPKAEHTRKYSPHNNQYTRGRKKG